MKKYFLLTHSDSVNHLVIQYITIICSFYLAIGSHHRYWFLFLMPAAKFNIFLFARYIIPPSCPTVQISGPIRQRMVFNTISEFYSVLKFHVQLIKCHSFTAPLMTFPRVQTSTHYAWEHYYCNTCLFSPSVYQRRWREGSFTYLIY